jgi:DNA-binding YbaB/EbfC family protein
MSNIGKIMKQAARLEQEMARVQQSLALKTVEGTAGGGTVKVVARCDQTIASISIAPAAVNPADVAFLEDLVLTAVNQALTQARETSQKEMSAVTKGISIPGLM